MIHITIDTFKGTRKFYPCSYVQFIYRILSISRMVLSVRKKNIFMYVIKSGFFGTEGHRFDAASLEIPCDVTWF